MSARLSSLRSQYLPFISKHRPVGSPAMIFIGPVPASSHPYFSITYTLFSIHSFAYPFYFLIAVHSLRKTPGGRVPGDQFFCRLATPIESIPCETIPFQAPWNLFITQLHGGGYEGIFPPTGRTQTQRASRGRSSKNAIGAARSARRTVRRLL